MSQNDFVITRADANSGQSMRNAINAALQALASNNSGATEPADTWAYMWWPDTTAGRLKQRNAADTGWIDKGPLANAYNVLTEAFNEAQGANIASASTTDIGAAGGNFVKITGNTTITGLGTVQAGTRRIVEFTGTPTLTHNATSLILPTGANITAAAGDTAVFVSLGGGNWKCVAYQRASGAALSAPASTAIPPVRQTVLHGPVDSNGLPNFGGSTGSAVVTASGTITATAAGGYADRTGSITNPSWTGLTSNGTMYLFLDIAADGTCTTAVSTQAPVYQEGGTPATTSGLLTFNIAEMTGYLGNGTTAPQAYRVCVGQVTVSANVVTAIVWYALRGRYRAPAATPFPATSSTTTFNHNIGVTPSNRKLLARCLTAELGFAIGDVITPTTSTSASANQSFPHLPSTSLTSKFTVGDAAFLLTRADTASLANATAANWSYWLEADRGW